MYMYIYIYIYRMYVGLTGQSIYYFGHLDP